MQIGAAIFGSLLSALSLIQHTVATSSPLEPHGLHRRHVEVSGGMRRRTLEVRQTAPSTTTTTPAIAPDMITWNAQVEAACMASLTALNGVALNPAGLAVCYNVPFMDNSTGVFEAELRVYNISEPTGEWAGVTTANIRMALAYLGATVQRSNGMLDGVKPNLPTKRDPFSTAEMEKRAEFAERQTRMPTEVKVSTYVGQFNVNIKGPQFNDTRIQALLIPQIELIAVNPTQNNMQLQTVLSSKEANFIKGVFAQASGTTITPAAIAQASALANSLAPFVLPGTTLGIFPTGLIVTSIWVFLFLGFVGAGTVGRYQFADQYKRNMRAADAANINTI